MNAQAARFGPRRFGVFQHTDSELLDAARIGCLWRGNFRRNCLGFRRGHRG